MMIKAHLRDPLTGTSRIVETGPYKEAHTAIYHWTEGNYECDCNRSRFLWDWDESKMLECNTGEPRIELERLEDGDGRYLWGRIITI